MTSEQNLNCSSQIKSNLKALVRGLGWIKKNKTYQSLWSQSLSKNILKRYSLRISYFLTIVYLKKKNSIQPFECALGNKNWISFISITDLFGVYRSRLVHTLVHIFLTKHTEVLDWSIPWDFQCTLHRSLGPGHHIWGLFSS